jgi:uncharacterized damage-inducible protein DinB
LAADQIEGPGNRAFISLHLAYCGCENLLSQRTTKGAPMTNSEMTLLYDHLYWMRNKILKAAAEAPEVLIERAPATIRDLRATLIHELDVEWSWRERLRGIPFDTWGPDGELKPDDYPTLKSIRHHWERDEEEMRAWLATLTDETLKAPWEVEKPGGRPLWQHLMHLYTHGIQQFSDAAVILSRADSSPGELDFLEFLERTGRSSD